MPDSAASVRGKQPPLPRRALYIPAVLILALTAVVWFTVFAGGLDDVPPGLKERKPGEMNGIWAARFAIDEIVSAVPDEDPEHSGLLAGDPASARVKYRDRGPNLAGTWIVLVHGPLRVRPNTPEEFVSQDGEILIELTAFGADILQFSAGRGVRSSLDISPDGFALVPLRFFWPPHGVWMPL